ncbi:L,D-transpeptidase family protein [Thermosipho atlanticus]|uniref:LysM domain-containing protein n=1 Tax=Thermosipho atlanticus DSM 15807 TaxID=1123380 RepID=A0A1M5T199_9BACT|nr:L,D-transpeptidase family protein [Thermosipho atlanticus]SHH44133.1 LysM domain-containing protein [Thermosipho atlanticus DSM 15807]
MKKILSLIFLYIFLITFGAHYVEIETVTSTEVLLSVTPYYEPSISPKVYLYTPTGFIIARKAGNNLYEFRDGNYSWVIPIVYGKNNLNQIVTGVVSNVILDLREYKKSINLKVYTDPESKSLVAKVETEYTIVKAKVDDIRLDVIKTSEGYLLITKKPRKEFRNQLIITIRLKNGKEKKVEYNLFTLNGFTTYLRGDFTPYITNIFGTHTVKKGEILWEIANKYGVRTADLQIINKLEDPNKIYPGMKLKIGTVQFLEGLTTVVVNLSTSRLAVYYAGKLVKIFPVAIGRSDATPPGIYWILDKQIDPALYWYGEYIPPRSPINGLGTRFLQFSNPTYGIHGTTKPWEIGRRISHGCIRMFNFDVETLDAFVNLGSPVIVIKEYKNFPDNLSDLPEFTAFKEKMLLTKVN